MNLSKEIKKINEQYKELQQLKTLARSVEIDIKTNIDTTEYLDNIRHRITRLETVLNNALAIKPKAYYSEQKIYLPNKLFVVTYEREALNGEIFVHEVLIVAPSRDKVTEVGLSGPFIDPFKVTEIIAARYPTLYDMKGEIELEKQVKILYTFVHPKKK